MKTLFESQMDFFAWDEERPDVAEWYADEIVNYDESTTGVGVFKLYHLKLVNGKEDEIMLSFGKSTDGRTIAINAKYYTKHVTLGNFCFYVTSAMTAKHWKDRSEYTLNIFQDELAWNHHLGLPKELVEDIIKIADEQVTEHERDLYDNLI